MHESINVMNRLFVSIFILIMMGQLTMAQTKITEPTSFFIIHSSGNHLKRGTDNGGYLEAANVAKPQKMTFIPDGKGYYSIQPSTGEAVFLSKLNAWNTSFVADSAQDNAKFSIEDVSGAYILLRCKGNGLCLGTDGNDPEQKVYSDKNGSDVKHYWFLSDKVNGTPPVDTLSYLVSPSSIRQHFDGWGVSLCWWANMCGHWSDEKIDQIITWLEEERDCEQRCRDSRIIREMSTIGTVMRHNGKSCSKSMKNGLMRYLRLSAIPALTT